MHNGGQHVGDDRAVGSRWLRRRGRAVRIATLAAVVAAPSGLALLDCGIEAQTLGAACVKGEDCLSGICSDQVCVAAPPLLDGEPPPSDGSVEGTKDVATEDSKMPPPDASPSLPIGT